MSKRFKQVNVQHFATLVQEIQISKINQKDFVEIVEEMEQQDYITFDLEKDLRGLQAMLDDLREEIENE